MEVGLGPGHTVLDGDPASPPPRQKMGHRPQFSAHVCCGQTAGRIKMPVGTKVGHGPCHIVVDGGPSSPPKKKGTACPNFRPMSIVAKRSSPISANAEHLYKRLPKNRPTFGELTDSSVMALFDSQSQCLWTVLCHPVLILLSVRCIPL